MKEKSLCLFALFLPLEQLMLFLFGIDTELKPYRIFLFLTLAIVVLSKNVSNTIITKELKFFVFIFIYGSIMALVRFSYFGKGDLSYIINSTTHFLIGLIILYLISNIKSKNDLYTLGNYFLIGVVLSSLYGVYEYVLVGQFRLRGFFNNPNHLAFAINFVTPFLIYKIYYHKKKLHNYLLIIFLTGIVFLSGSRTGTIAQIICILFLIFIFKRSIINVIWVALSGLLFYSLIFKNKFIGENLLSRFSGSKIATGSGRFDIAESAINLGIDSGFLGVGIGQYRYYHLDYIAKDAYITVLKFKLSTHNTYLDILVNFGIFSAFLFLLVLKENKKNINLLKNKDDRKIALLFFMLLLVTSYSQEMFIFPIFWLAISILTIKFYNFKNF